MSEKFPSQMQDKFTVRFPDGMRDVIAAMAKNDGRSINSEIIALLELAIRVCRDFGPEDGPVVQQFRERLDALGSKNDKTEQEKLIPQLLEIIERQKKQVDKLIDMVERSTPLSGEYKKKYLGDDDIKPT
ncbi:TPA: Arc family DNA-binding protein [Citrobacter freundii]